MRYLSALAERTKMGSCRNNERGELSIDQIHVYAMQCEDETERDVGL